MMIRKILLMGVLVAIPTMAGATQAKAEEYCREYTKTVTIGGRVEEAYGTACYQPDGSWEVVNLEGTDYGRAQVRNVIYEDLQRDYRRAPVQKVVVKERYTRPNYSRYNRYNQHYGVNYSPFIIRFDNEYKDKRHSSKNYKKASYKNYDRYEYDRRSRR